MNFFQQIEGEACIIIDRGVFKQVDLYERGGELFAKLGGGFIRLMSDGSTTKSNARLDAISFDALGRDHIGRLCRTDTRVAGIKPLDEAKARLLLGNAAE